MNTKIWTEARITELAAFRADHTLKQCGQRYGVTHERIRQIMAKEARRLRSNGWSWELSQKTCHLPVDDWMLTQPNYSSTPK